MYGWAKLTAIALPTAVTFMLVGGCLLLVRPTQGITAIFTTTRTGRELFLTFLVPFIILALLTGYVKLHGERLGWYDPATGTGIITLAFIMFFSLILYRNAKELNKRELAQELAQRVLQSKEAELLEAQRIAHVGHWSMDSKTGVVTASEEVYLIQGLDPKKPYPLFREEQRDYYTLTPDSWDRVSDAVKRAIDTGRGYEVDLESRRPDGVNIWFTARAEVVRDVQGEIIGLRGTVQDITERKNAEEKLRRSAERLSLAQQAGRVGIYDWDIVTNQTFWTSELEEIFGVAKGSFEDRYEAWAKRVHPDDLIRVEAFFKEWMQSSREEDQWEYRFFRNQEERWISARGLLLRDPSGKPLHMVGTNLDITERKRAEVALQESEGRFRGFMEQAPLSVQVFTPDGRTVEVNQAWENLWGVSFAQIAEYNILQDLQLKSEGILPYIKQAFAGEAVEIPAIKYNVEKTLPGRSRHQDSRRWVSAVAYPLKDDNGQVREVVLIHQDITSRMRAEEAVRTSNDELRDLTIHLEKRVEERTLQLEKQTVQLRQLAVVLTRVEQSERKRLAQVLHDHLQQLLVAARMRVELIERKTPSIEKKALGDLRSYIEQAGQAALSLTAELRPPVLYESGLEAALQFLTRKMDEQYKLKVVLESSSDAEPASDFIKAILYASVQELLFNAAKYANVTECLLKLARAPNQNIVVTLRDEGQGFNPDEIGQRINGGLGLFSIRERIKALGGEFTVQSVPGEGSTFEISIPDRAEISASEEQIYREKVFKNKNAPKNDGGMIILLADDHKIVRQSLAALLTAQSWVKEVIEAEDGEDVVNKFEQCHPDVVLMDLNMPKRNGIEATRILSAMDPTAKIIGLSVQTDQETARTMIKAGAVAYLNKAADTETLMETLKNFAVSSGGTDRS